MRTALLNKILLLLALAGIVVAGTLTYSSFLNVIVPCGVGDGCKDVANHPSSKWFGIPVAAFGMGAYLVLALLTAVRMVKGLEATRMLGWLGYGIALVGAIVSIGLQVYSGLVIKAWCTWCVGSAVIMVVLYMVHAMLAQAEAGTPAAAEAAAAPRRKSDMPFLIAASVVGVIALVASGYIAKERGYTGAKFVAKEADVPLLAPPDANSIGPLDAPVTIVEFGDLCCSACHRSYALVKDVLKAHEGKIRFVFRHFPLYTLHKNAFRASVYAEHAANDGKFWKFLDTVYATSPEEVDNEANLQNLALSAGLDVTKADADFVNENSPAFERVYRDFTLANNLGIKSTPTFFLITEGERPFAMAIGDILRLLESDPKYRKLLGKQ